MSFSNNLKLLLQSYGWKQAELCRRTGIQTSLMSDYLAGKKSPTIGNAILIADAFDISLDRLVGKDSNLEIESKQTSLAILNETAKTLSEQELLYAIEMMRLIKKHFD